MSAAQLAATGNGRRILVVAYCFPPNGAIGTHRTLRLVTHLANTGWHIDVLTARPQAYLPGTPVDERLLERVPSSVRVIRTGALRGFTKAGRVIQRLRGPRPAPPANVALSPGAASQHPAATPGLKTWLEELCAMPDKDVGWLAPALLRALGTLPLTRPQVVFSSAPPWTTHVLAGALAQVFRCRWVADFRDPWVRSPWTRYRTRSARAVGRRLERFAVRRADAVVFTTNAARHEFASHYGPTVAGKLRVVFNGCDPTEVESQSVERDDTQFVLLHAGTLYGGRSPVPLLGAVANLRRTHPRVAERLRIRFLGSTGFPGVDLAAVCRPLNLDGIVEFLPRVSRDESLRQMQRASALLILQGGTAMAIPGKLYEYLAVGRPVLALCEPGEMTQFIKANRLGMTALPADRAEIERSLLALLSAAPHSWPKADASLYDGRLRAAEMASIIESVLQPSSNGVLAAQVESGGRRA